MDPPKESKSDIAQFPGSSRTMSSPVCGGSSDRPPSAPVTKSASWHPLHKDSVTLDAPLIVTNTKEEFFVVNRPIIKKKILDEAQDHVLGLKWNTIIKKRIVHEDEPIVKRPRIFISKDIFEEPFNHQNNNELPRKKILVRECESNDVKVKQVGKSIKIKSVSEFNGDKTKDKDAKDCNSKNDEEFISQNSTTKKRVTQAEYRKWKRQSDHLEEKSTNVEGSTSKDDKENNSKNDKKSNKTKLNLKESVIDLTKSCSEAFTCKCDDCKYVTEAHKKRILTGKFKCKCHPCQLRQDVLMEKDRKTDPYKVVKLSNYKGGSLSFWRESWIDDLFSDIFEKKLSLEEASVMIGSSRAVTDFEFKKYENKVLKKV